MNTKHLHLEKFFGSIRWSLIRHRFYIPIFVLVQVVLSFAVIYGFLFITDASDKLSQSYLCTGAIAINIIAVTCVLAPQIVSEAKQNGVYDYQKTLPVPRVGILCADLLIWGLLCLPGIITSLLISHFAFGLSVDFGILSLLALLLIVFSLLSLGFAIAYIFPANVVSLATQLIMIGGLLFSPIVYSETRLPSWTAYLYNILPFVPSSHIIRSQLFHLTQNNIQHLVILAIWAIIGFTISLTALSRRH